MEPLWHPLSTILIDEPRCFATVGLTRMLLASERGVELVYAGDGMWPALRHGDHFRVEPLGDGTLAPGTVVLVAREGIPDLLRVVGVAGGDVRLTADADPRGNELLPREAVLGRACLPLCATAAAGAWRRRLWLDLREAWSGRVDGEEDPAATVRDKYEDQATYYARVEGDDMDDRLLTRVRERARAGGRILVVGSGTGRECFALAEAGWRVLGVEFSPAMVALSVAEASRRKLAIEFRELDVRELRLGPASCDGVFFTYGVYGLIPSRRDRVALLRRLRGWLCPGGVVFLSAGWVRGLYDRMVLSLEWLERSRHGETEWGDSHSRWIPNDGKMHRSFLHIFSDARLRAESASADFRMGCREGGHVVLTPTRLL